MSLADAYERQVAKCIANFRMKAEVYDRDDETWEDKFPHGMQDIAYEAWKKSRRLNAALERAGQCDSEEARRAIFDSLQDLANYMLFGMCILEEEGVGENELAK